MNVIALYITLLGSSTLIFVFAVYTFEVNCSAVTVGFIHTFSPGVVVVVVSFSSFSSVSSFTFSPTIFSTGFSSVVSF